MYISEKEEEKVKSEFASNLNSVISTHFNGMAKNLADLLDTSKTNLSGYTSGKRVPNYGFLQKFVSLGFSVDYLITGKGAMLLWDAASVEDARLFLETGSLVMVIQDDKMSKTIIHGDVARLGRVGAKDVEIGGIYFVKKSTGGKFLARLIGSNTWQFDNVDYKGFDYTPVEKDEVFKLVQVTKNHFPL